MSIYSNENLFLLIYLFFLILVKIFIDIYFSAKRIDFHQTFDIQLLNEFLIVFYKRIVYNVISSYIL